MATTPIAPANAPTLLGVSLAGLMVVTGCSSEPADPDPSGTEVATDAHRGVEALLDPQARPDQRGVGAGAQRAASFGFDRQIVATDDEISTARDEASERQDQAEATQVSPSSCQQAIAKMDWSPLLADSEQITRLDFGTETFNGAGTIEIAGLDAERGGGAQAQEQLDAYQATVEELTGDCSEVDLDIPSGESTLTYTMRSEAVEPDQGSGLLWSRVPRGSATQQHGEAVTALVLTTEHDGYAVMVSFAGDSEVSSEEFRTMADEILEATLSGIDGEVNS
ncbi:hypothetical protein [Auritidibacter ignavus]|uniref:hypothetical protein n=1 Tax=Auritidibacter ignavus TaxID=678932 RepID=UPI0024B89496|nr:hypothetical protein [Auritidibacter ignavus]WHS28691.1 hypothetical protein QM395_02855 [Auritidibacter ignavus]